MSEAERRGRRTSAEKARQDKRLGEPTTEQALGLAMRHHGAGRLRQAEAIYQQILDNAPDHPVALQLLGIVTYQAGNSQDAIELITKALTIKPDYAEANYNLGNILKELGRLDEAVARYEKALAIQPNYAEAHTNLGATLQLLGSYGDAAACCRKALAIRPDNVEAHNNLAAALYKLGQLDDAVASYRNAIALKPDYVQAHANLAELFEKSNQTEDLRAAVADAKRHCPDDLRIALREAWLLKRDGDYAKARAVLENAGGQEIDPHFLAARAHLLGDLCDRMDDVDAAFGHCEKGNLLCAETIEAKNADGSRQVAQIDELTKQFTPRWVQGWSHFEPTDDRSDPVFLVGFPRSGTTLLDTILRSHPAIAVVEEKPALWSARQALRQMGKDYPAGLAELNRDGFSKLRSTYFAELDTHLGPDNKGAVVIDKLPLNLVHAGFIQRIFPQARLLFAQRHPCDCVLSCFMREFVLNDSMANFLDLDDAAHFYAKAMTLWQQYQAVLPLAVHSVRYEALIETLKETLEPLLDFLDLGWDDRLHDYRQTAYRRQKISTPSYNQVTQPLYTRASGRWERYRAHLQPVLPVLLPWAKTFGYG
jgi:tetratricopeptide (TPR) repeat protein